MLTRTEAFRLPTLLQTRRDYADMLDDLANHSATVELVQRQVDACAWEATTCGYVRGVVQPVQAANDNARPWLAAVAAWVLVVGVKASGLLMAFRGGL